MQFFFGSLYALFHILSLLVGSSGIEPPTLRLSGARSNQLSYEPIRYLFSFVTSHEVSGGDEESRTPDPLLARQMLSQLSYTPIASSLIFLFFMSPENRTANFFLHFTHL